MATKKRPVVAITMGDPAGVGPEVIVKALEEGLLQEIGHNLVIGDAALIMRTAHLLEARLKVKRVKWPSSEEHGRGVLEVLDVQNVNAQTLRMGVVQAAAGKAAFECVERAIEMALAGAVDAIVTAPVNKEALRSAAVPYLDHTEMFAGLTNCHDLLTMFAVDRLKIFFVTRHLSLRRALEEITAERVLSTIEKADAALRRFGWLEARIALAALNPHGGEHGLFGNEEETELTPAVRTAREKGINVVGPVPADSVFHLCQRGEFDAVVALYHDQGHIAAKTLDFERTVSITTGLPFVRTSVDHGTAYDIAGQGIASAASMIEAIRMAAEYDARMRGIEARTARD